MKIKLPRPLNCLRCGYTWVPRKEVVLICPKCKRASWNTPKPEASQPGEGKLIKAYCTSDGTLRERFGVEAMLKTLGEMRAKRDSRARLTSAPS